MKATAVEPRLSALPFLLLDGCESVSDGVDAVPYIATICIGSRKEQYWAPSRKGCNKIS